MSGGLLEKSIKKWSQWSWKQWLKRSNLLFMAHTLIKTSSNFTHLLIPYLQSLRPKDIDQQRESPIDTTASGLFEQQIGQNYLQTIIFEYQNQRVSKQIEDTLKKVKQFYKSGNLLEANSLLSQMLVEQNKSDKAISLLKSGVKKLQKLKERGSTVYIEDYLDLKENLILLQAVKSNIYQRSLKQLNNIYDAYLQYFLDHRITFLNNLSLAIQKSQRSDRYQESIAYLHEALNFLLKYVLLKDERVYYTVNNLACAYFESGEHKTAHELFSRLLSQMQSSRQKHEQMLRICENNYKHYFPQQRQ